LKFQNLHAKMFGFDRGGDRFRDIPNSFEADRNGPGSTFGGFGSRGGYSVRRRFTSSIGYSISGGFGTSNGFSVNGGFGNNDGANYKGYFFNGNYDSIGSRLNPVDFNNTYLKPIEKNIYKEHSTVTRRS